MTTSQPFAILLPDQPTYGEVYGPAERAAIAARSRLSPVVFDTRNWRDHPAVCAETEVIFASWGMAKLDAEFLAAFPKLRAVLYAAGSIKHLVTDEFWASGIPICSAAPANAVPVAEFAVAQIVLAAKHAWPLSARVHRERGHSARANPPGMYRSVVGLISLGAIGRLVAERLRSYDVEVIAYDPYLSPARAAELGVRTVSLAEIFAQSDVVSCHAPLLDATRHLLKAEHFGAMKRGASFINTARGGVVDEPCLIEVLRARPDLTALLDVTDPEPPAPDSPLYDLPNVFLTPHIAGSIGPECRRMAQYMIEEFDRLQGGQPLRYTLTREQVALMG